MPKINRIYVWQKLVRPNYDTSEWLILESRMGKPGTSNFAWLWASIKCPYIWDTVFNWQFWNVNTTWYGGNRVALTCYNQNTWWITYENFNNANWTWFKEFRFKVDKITWTIYWEIWNQLDVWNPINSRSYQNDLYKWITIYPYVKSNDSYYNTGQFDRLRIKNMQGEQILYTDFDTIPTWMKLIRWNWSSWGDIWNHYSLSNWILTLSINESTAWANSRCVCTQWF